MRRIQNRMGRMSPLSDPVPRAGRTERAAESYLKPRLLSFIELNRKILNLLYRTTEVREIEMDTLSFNSALISSEFNLLEEGTTDRVLYRIAGLLTTFANNFYGSMRNQIEALDSVKGRDSTYQYESARCLDKAMTYGEIGLVLFNVSMHF